ncbi:MAG: ABC transporter ATP-binding protein [Kineosporiaceae bacterium]
MPSGVGVESFRDVLSVRAVTHCFGERRALDEVTFSLPGRVVALVGVNGAGKSTLMRILAGGLTPTSGDVRLDGQNLYGKGRAAALGNVALMPQEMSVPPRLTVRDLVSYLCWMRAMPSRHIRARVDQALALVELHDRADHKLGSLSGGMRRRVALAQALACDAKVLLLDEPSTGLDPQQRRQMVEAIRSIDRAVLMSSHVIEDVVDVASHVAVLHEGRLRFMGPLAELQSLGDPSASGSAAAESGFLRIITGRQG